MGLPAPRRAAEEDGVGRRKPTAFRACCDDGGELPQPGSGELRADLIKKLEDDLIFGNGKEVVEGADRIDFRKCQVRNDRSSFGGRGLQAPGPGTARGSEERPG